MLSNPKLNILFFILPFLSFSQDLEKTFYRDGVLAKVVWFDQNFKKDSLKTYYKSGKLNETFRFNDNEEFHGSGVKYDKQGNTLTTWLFSNGKLIKRTDHKIDSNPKNKDRITKQLKILESINRSIRNGEISDKLLYTRSYIRFMLFNTTLALEGFNTLNEKIENNTLHFDHKKNAAVYDALASIYDLYEMKDMAIHYKLKAIATSPEQSRLYHNLGSYLILIKSYRLGISYLNKALNFNKNHSFANWALAAAHTDLENYEKAMECVTISFEREKSLYKHGAGSAERNIQTIRGWLHHKLGNSQKGILDLEAALKQNQNNSFALRNLGVIYHDLGNFNKSCELLQKAIELGYEKTHDFDDLQIYLDAACVQEKTKSKITSLNSLPFIHPNPAKNIVKIENYSFSNFEYEIYNYNSQLIRKGLSNDSKIDVSKLSEGLYILKINNTESPQEFKLIKI